MNKHAATPVWEVKQAGSVWKIYYHGAWQATRNSKREADEFVRARREKANQGK